MPRRHRTPRSLMTLRVGLSTWMIIFLTCLFAGLAPGIALMVVVLAVIAVMMLVISILVRIGGYLLFGDDPEYRCWVSEGGDPYFDLLPPPFNKDSWAVRAGGSPEPATDFVPPDDWMLQCSNCGARNPDNAAICWHCGWNGQQQLRKIICGNCGGSFFEPEVGALERRGVACPWCGTVAKAP